MLTYADVLLTYTDKLLRLHRVDMAVKLDPQVIYIYIYICIMFMKLDALLKCRICQHNSAYVSIRQHTSAYVCI